MSTLTNRLGAVKEQVARLIREHEKLRERLAEKDIEAREHQRSVAVLEARVTELERENEVLRKAKPVENKPNGPGAKERIDELVAEIDRCLELLNP